MNGWTLADVEALDEDQRAVLVEEINKAGKE